MKKFKEILFLQNIRGVGKVAIYKKYWNALTACKDVEDLQTNLMQLNSKLTDEILSDALKKAEEQYQLINAMSDVQVITVLDSDYPQGLNDMGNKKPLVLYAKGNTEILSKPGIAVIGTREPSQWSQQVEEGLVKKILELQPDRVIVSGLALGCDRIAHQTTVIEKGQTAAVLPSGVNVIVPAQHRQLAEDILAAGGCLVSEYEPDAKASRRSFVERDAIVATLSEKVIAVECGVHSGTMHTIDDAYEYGRIIGCYYPKTPDGFTKGDYSGNAYMAENKGAVKLLNTVTLTDFLNSKPAQQKTEEKIKLVSGKQMSFEDFLKTDITT